MDIQATLKDFKSRFDPKISEYFDEVEREAKKEDDLVEEALGHVRELILAGGKRLRPACMYYGYLAGGGKDTEAILKTAVSIELMHAFLLIHDDIVDRDGIRHGVKTLHRRYAEFGETHFPGMDTEHFGNSVALIVGDMLFAFGNDILFRSPFEKERIFEALSKLQSVVSYTVIGQARDIYMEYKRSASVEEILKMYENKTARYTLEGPMHLGAILAGAPKEWFPVISAYAIPLGIAFQIQDDILGVFGSEERIGKPVGSDIEEGKVTILVAYALERSNTEESNELRRILALGTKLTREDIDRFRDILRSTGSLDRAKALSMEYIETGKRALLPIRETMAPEAFDFFSSVAEYMAEREY